MDSLSLSDWKKPPQKHRVPCHIMTSRTSANTAYRRQKDSNIPLSLTHDFIKNREIEAEKAPEMAFPQKSCVCFG